MEVFEAIFNRRSIRDFKEENIEDEKIKKIIKAGMYAPSGMNTQPWHFIILTDKQKIDKICQIHIHAQMAKKAPVSIVVCMDKTKEKIPGLLPQDCSASTQNILLASKALGLGSVWTGIHPNEKKIKWISEILNLPEHIIPFSMIVIGKEKQKQEKPDRFDEKKIHYETW